MIIIIVIKARETDFVSLSRSGLYKLSFCASKSLRGVFSKKKLVYFSKVS